ncbi:MAG: DUF1836 domain-containing protein [Ruminococcaceae bacterium]|nr:DUF1836 domain-containing protein [Oscillospiraceae bacterium]
MPLYMDQVVLVLKDALGDFADVGEAVLTPSMVNNYVKHKMVPPPEKKKYGRKQLAALVVVSMMKRVLSMQEITALIGAMVADYGIEAAYDLFCQRLEAGLNSAFDASIQVERGEGALGALDAALVALCGKLYLQDYLAGLPQPQPEKGKGKEAKEKKPEKPDKPPLVGAEPQTILR